MESPAPTINTWAGTNNASTFDTWEDLEFYSCCAQIQLYNPICTVIFLSLLLDVNLAAPVPTHWFKCPEKKVRNGLRFCSWATNRILIFQLRSRWVLLCWSNGLKKDTGPTNKLSHCCNAGTTWSHFWAQPRTGFLGTRMHWDWARRSFSVPRSQQKCPANLDRDLVHSKSDQKSNRLRIRGTPQKSGNTNFKCNWLKNIFQVPTTGCNKVCRAATSAQWQQPSLAIPKKVKKSWTFGGRKNTQVLSELTRQTIPKYPKALTVQLLMHIKNGDSTCFNPGWDTLFE